MRLMEGEWSGGGWEGCMDGWPPGLPSSHSGSLLGCPQVSSGFQTSST